MKLRTHISTILFTLVSIVIFLSAMGKFAGRETIASLFTGLGMEEYMLRIATAQLIIVVCLMWKPLRHLGTLLGSAFLGGMIFMMVATGNNPLSAVLTLLMLWVAYKLHWWNHWRSHKEAPHEFITSCNCKDDQCTC